MKLSLLENNYFLLFLIFFLACFLRIFHLGSLSQSFHTDEVAAGYVGRYILLHGQDICRNIFSLYFDKFGDFWPIGISWLSGLSTFIFGINEFAVRFPSAFFGAATVLPLFLLVKSLFNKPKMGIFVGLFLAILPWHIVLFRATSEGIVGLFLLTFSLYFAFFYSWKVNISCINIRCTKVLTFLFTEIKEREKKCCMRLIENLITRQFI